MRIRDRVEPSEFLFSTKLKDDLEPILSGKQLPTIEFMLIHAGELASIAVPLSLRLELKILVRTVACVYRIAPSCKRKRGGVENEVIPSTS